MTLCFRFLFAVSAVTAHPAVSVSAAADFCFSRKEKTFVPHLRPFFQTSRCDLCSSNTLMAISEEWLIRISLKIESASVGYWVNYLTLTLPKTLILKFSKSNFEIALLKYLHVRNCWSNWCRKWRPSFRGYNFRFYTSTWQGQTLAEKKPCK